MTQVWAVGKKGASVSASLAEVRKRVQAAHVMCTLRSPAQEVAGHNLRVWLTPYLESLRGGVFRMR